MQLIAEAYDLLRRAAGLLAGARSPRSSAGWNAGRLESYLIEITAEVLGAHRRRRPASRSSTSCSTRPSRRAPAAGPCRSRSTSACRSAASPRRCSPASLSGARRRCARPRPRPARPGGRPARRRPAPSLVDGRRAGAVRVEDRRVRAGLRPDPGRQRGVRLGHRPGRDGHDLAGRLHHPGPVPGPDQARRTTPTASCPRCWSTTTSRTRSASAQDAWRRVVDRRDQQGIPAPGFASALAYYDGLRAERLPAALIQGQRDFFGAHTYRRVDREGSFHTLWATTTATRSKPDEPGRGAADRRRPDAVDRPRLLPVRHRRAKPRRRRPPINAPASSAGSGRARWKPCPSR